VSANEEERRALHGDIEISETTKWIELKFPCSLRVMISTFCEYSWMKILTLIFHRTLTDGQNDYSMGHGDIEMSETLTQIKLKFYP
jgi:hypothetical protein